MTNKELRLQCLLEAADLLAESAGANGAAKRFYDERVKKDEKCIKENEARAEQYKRAGYADKGPAKEIEYAKKRLQYHKQMRNAYDTHKSDRTIDTKRDRATASKRGWGPYYDEGEEYINAYKSTPEINKYYNPEDLKEHKKFHKRINERAKSQNETIETLLNEAYDLLNETSYNEKTNKDSWSLYADGKWIGDYTTPSERDRLIEKYESKNK